MKNKKWIPWSITVILSLLYIFLGHRYVIKNQTNLHTTASYDTYSAVVQEIVRIDPVQTDLGGTENEGKIITFKALVKNGTLKGEVVTTTQEMSPYFIIQPMEIDVGDKILITQAVDIETGQLLSDSFVMIEYMRTDFIVYLIILFMICLILFGRNKGFLTILSLIFTCASIFLVFIPSVLTGQNIYLWSIITCIFITVMTLLITGSYTLKSLSAGIGCIGGILVAGVIAIFSNHMLKLTGMVDDESVFLQMLNPENPIDMKAIVFAAVLIGSIGAIMDVAISIASSLNEIKEQNPEISFIKLFNSGMTIGRDIMGTMTNTLILAYIGGSLSMVLLLIANTGSIAYLLNTEMIIIELLQSIIGSLGILLTLPLTSFISAFLYTKKLR